MNQGLLPSIAPILAAPWQHRRSSGSLWGMATIVVLAAVGPAVVFCWSVLIQLHLVDRTNELANSTLLAAEMRHSSATAGLWALGGLLLIGWAVTVSNLLDQNRPALARLVPAHPGRLRAALLLAWTALIAMLTLLVGQRFGAPLVCATLSAAVLAVLAASVRWPAMWLLGSFAPAMVNNTLQGAGLDRLIDAVRRQWLAQPATIFLTVAAASALLLVSLIQRGGARHVASDEARRKRAQRFRMRALGAQPVATGTRNCIDTWLALPYHAWWRHVFARNPGATFSRVMLGLGPGVHWTAGFSAVVGTALAIVVGFGVLEAVGLVFPTFASFVPSALSCLAMGLPFGLLSSALNISARLHQGRREQALLALLPGVPRDGVLNRRLAWQLTAQFMATWLGGLLLSALCLELAARMHPGLVGHILVAVRDGVVVATLPLVVFQWRCWARVPVPTALNSLVPLAAAALIGALSFAGNSVKWFSLAPLAVVIVVGSVVWCALRWHRMGREPSAFPAGRLAA